MSRKTRYKIAYSTWLNHRDNYLLHKASHELGCSMTTVISLALWEYFKKQNIKLNATEESQLYTKYPYFKKLEQKKWNDNL